MCSRSSVVNDDGNTWNSWTELARDDDRGYDTMRGKGENDMMK